MEFDMVMVGQDHVGKSEADMTGRREFLFDGGKGHGAAGINKKIDKEVHLFAEELDIKPVTAGEDPPVEIADVVPWRVPAVIGELETGPPARRRVTPRPAAEKLLARLQPQGLQAIEKIRGKRGGEHKANLLLAFLSERATSKKG
jgi:hypothetical protein